MMKSIKILMLATTFLSLSSYASIDDSGLTGPVTPLRMSVSTELAPSEVIPETQKFQQTEAVSFLRKNGELQKLEHLKFSTDKSCSIENTGEPIQFVARLESSHINVKKTGTYRVQFSGVCGTRYKVIFDSTAPEGQAVMIWEVASRAVQKFTEIQRLEFWGGPLQISWPADGDYYSWGTVYITRGDYWDVVGHEIGHAIYDRANIGALSGGQHYIDQCYTDSLALSEGWASFFSAWISVDRNDPAAKFEFMVPRRAPLGIETVPDDVCAGPTNEWRVYAFLWDVIDLNDDGELSTVEFQRYWDIAYNQNVRSMVQKSHTLVRGGVDQNHLQKLWELNFKTPGSHW